MVGTNIKELRNEHHMTQTQLAKKLNVSDKTVSSWEVGRTKPDIDMLARLAALFGVQIERLRKSNLDTPADLEAFIEYLSKLGYYIDDSDSGSEGLLHISGNGINCTITVDDFASFKQDIMDSVSYNLWKFSKKV